jgi:hypothetical protein
MKTVYFGKQSDEENIWPQEELRNTKKKEKNAYSEALRFFAPRQIML